ncbi:MAG TPA: NAD(FAD)-dependent dehydrogenase [Desulfobacteraceae bacterium]|nr:NAD(FAD)-dependent dehydrogenase [Desulfobacteraceae bacterium]
MRKEYTTTGGSTPGFTSDDTRTETVFVILDGTAVALPKDVSVAAGLLGIGEMISRISPSSQKPCSPHCLMGVCYECMMEINGVQRQACLTDPEEGMVINRRLNSQGYERVKGDKA